jgi:DNA-binding transcriptional ArsR family regulator
MKEYKTLELLIEGLESGRILPPSVQAKRVATNQSFQSEGRNAQPDAIVQFTVSRPHPKTITAVIELKSRLQPLALEGVIHQVLGHRNELERSGAYQDLYPMVAAPYISESVQARCKELGVGYVDLNGTLGLIHKDVYIDVVRPAIAFKNPQGIKNIFSGRSRRILRVLLVHPYQPYRLEQLASETGLSVGQVSQVLRRLQSDGLVTRNSEGSLLTQPRRLLRLFAEELKGDYLRNRIVFSGFSEKDPLSLAHTLSELCRQRDIQHAFTLGSGLESNERNVREQLTAAYISVSPERLRDDLKLEEVGKGANVFLMTPPETDNTDAGGVFYQSRALTNGLTGVNPVQLYLDFTLHGNRGKEQADFLVEHALGFRE